MRSVALATILGIVGVFAPHDAWAQDKAAAEQLFKQGRALMKAKKYEAACAKFAASQKLDPAVGTLLNLATCYQKQGKIASAWARFVEASDTAKRAGQRKRQRYARKRARALQKRLPRLEVAAPKLEGLRVTRNGEEMDPALFGTAVPIDPGEYQIVVSAPGYTPYRRRIEIREGQRIIVKVPDLAKRSEPVAARVPPESSKPKRAGNKVRFVATDVDAREYRFYRRQRRRRLLGAGIAAAGLVVTGIGLVFGAQARSTWNQAFDEGHCNSNNQCDQTGFDLTEDARGKATLSTVFVAAGLATAGIGGYLYLTGRRHWKPRLEAKVTSRGALIGVTGGF